MVSAWAGEKEIVLGQVAVDEKSNGNGVSAITAIPKLLELLDICGATVSIDAMGCQKEIAAGIRKRKGDYILAVKENQPRLYQDIKDLTCSRTQLVLCQAKLGLQVFQKTQISNEIQVFCYF
jgi:hypothetical protein